MKRTCFRCRKVYDDGLKRPPSARPAAPGYNPAHNHGICRACWPIVCAEIDKKHLKYPEGK